MSKKGHDIIHQAFIQSIQDIDREVIYRFISKANEHQPIDGNDAFYIARLLEALISGAHRGINMTSTMRNVMGMSRKRTHKLGAEAVSPGGVAWNIVERKVKGEISRSDGLREFEKLDADVDPRTLARWFDLLVTEVEKHREKSQQMIDFLSSLETKTTDK